MGHELATSALPIYYRRALRDTFKESLERACRDFRVQQAFVGYVEDDVVTVDPYLWIGRPTFPVRVLGPDEGLCGWAIRENTIFVYPQDPGSHDHIVFVDKDHTVSEIAGPILFREQVTGVVLLHSSDPDCKFSHANKAAFRQVLDEMNKAIQHVEEARDIAARRLTRLAQDCVDGIDRNVRGYIAVKDWDGGLQYFYASPAPGNFLALDPWEGLCGEVFATGEPILANNVFEHPGYRQSDRTIRSEFVYPIVDGSETIGVVNLESRDPDAFRNARDSVTATAAEASGWARTFREPPSDHFGYLLGDYVCSVAGLLEFQSHRPDEKSELTISDRIIGLLTAKAQRALRATRAAWWRDLAAPPFATDRVEFADRVLVGGFENPDEGVTVYAPVTLSGRPYGVVAVEKRQHDGDDGRILQTFCRVSAFFLQHGRRENRSRASVRLLRKLATEQTAKLLEDAVRLVPFLVGGESCTLFYKTKVFGRDVFVPGPSTLSDVFRARAEQDGDPWYEMNPEDGLTAWVGSKARSLRLNNIRDNQELRRIDPVLKWKKWLAEEGESRSYLACPIFEPGSAHTPEHVIGVLRTHRAQESERSGFSEDDMEALQAIASLLAAPLFDALGS